MSPEFGSTCAIFPIDEETLRYLRLSGRPSEHIAPTVPRSGTCRRSSAVPAPSSPSTRRRCATCAFRVARVSTLRRPCHDREHVAGVRQYLRHLPHRRGDAALLAPFGSPE